MDHPHPHSHSRHQWNLKVLIFVVATFSKACEPLAVSASRSKETGKYEYIFASSIVICEIVKFLIALICLTIQVALTKNSLKEQSHLYSFNIHESCQYVVPAVLLAVVNQMMFLGLEHLDPVLYQVIFKAISVVTTGLLTQILLKQYLNFVQWIALALLILGFYFSLPSIKHPSHLLQTASFGGILATALGALSFSAQAVYFEKASQLKAERSIFWQTMQLCIYGALANGVFLITRNWQILEQQHWNMLAGFDSATWIAIFAIAAADTTMTLLFKFLGSNVYNFSRVIAMFIAGILSAIFLDFHVTGYFVIGATLVTIAAQMYKKEQDKRIFLPFTNSKVSKEDD